MPRINEFIQPLFKPSVFSMLHADNEHWQIKLQERDTDEAEFTACRGLNGII